MYQLSRVPDAPRIDFRYSGNSRCCSNGNPRSDQNFCLSCYTLVCLRCYHAHSSHEVLDLPGQFEVISNRLRNHTREILTRATDPLQYSQQAQEVLSQLASFCDYSSHTLDNLATELERQLGSIKYYKAKVVVPLKQTIVGRLEQVKAERQLIEKKFEGCHKYLDDIPRASITGGLCKTLSHYTEFLGYCKTLDVRISIDRLTPSIQDCERMYKKHIEGRIATLEQATRGLRTQLRDKLISNKVLPNEVLGQIIGNAESGMGPDV